jgi:hypothetical protein
MDMPDDLGRSYSFVQAVEEARLQRLGPEQKAAIYILRSFELIFRDGKDWNAAIDRHQQLTGQLVEAMAAIIRDGETFKDAILRREIAQTAQRILDMRPIQ